MLPASDRVTAHYCEAIRGGIITQRCEKTHRHRLLEESAANVCACVCVCLCARVCACAFTALKTKGPFLSTFLSR